jgi:hypothetical protein
MHRKEGTVGKEQQTPFSWSAGLWYNREAKSTYSKAFRLEAILASEDK